MKWPFSSSSFAHHGLGKVLNKLTNQNHVNLGQKYIPPGTLQISEPDIKSVSHLYPPHSVY